MATTPPRGPDPLPTPPTSPPSKSTPSPPTTTDPTNTTTTSSVLDSLPTLPAIPALPTYDDLPTLTTQTAHPSDSHALAEAGAQPIHTDDRPIGAAQQAQGHDLAEVKDLGWHRDYDKADPAGVNDKNKQPLVGGIRDAELYTLIRRFNKQIFHVRAIDHPPPGNLDLYVAEDEEFTPDKLRATIERLYMTVIVGFAAVGKHIARLRSWNERRRTIGFALVYFLAWFLRLLLPTFLLLLLSLILSPRIRHFLFPPAPLALISASSGSIQTPPSGQLGSTTSLTGAPEQNSGEAVEQEATNFVSGLAGIAVSTAAGKADGQGADEQVDQESDGESGGSGAKSPSGSGKGGSALAGGVPDPTDIAVNMSAARRRASASSSRSGKSQTPHEAIHEADATAAPVHDAMSSKLVPVLRILCDLCDTYEKLGNAIEPSPPFPRYIPRLKLAGIIAPAFLGSFLLTPDLVIRSTTFGLGAAFFALPWIERGVFWIDKNFPEWRKALELRNHILRGVPTNAQLAVTLLRIGEVNKAPIPPPPSGDLERPVDKEKTVDVDHEELDGAMEGVDKDELHKAIQPESQGGAAREGGSLEKRKTGVDGMPLPDSTDDDDKSKKAKKKSGKGAWVLGLLRGTTRAGVSSILGADRVKAAVGSEHARRRLGVIASGSTPPGQGPIEFQARYKGKRGRIIISVAATTPSVGFVKESDTNVTFKDLSEIEVDEKGKVKPTPKGSAKSAVESLKKAVGQKGEKTVAPVWSVQVEDIRELRKVGGLGWKGKLVVGWALGLPLADGLEIVDKKGGRYMITAVRLRDELFNRLVAMASQKWEIC